MDVQLLGHPKSQATRKAQRFFSERRVPVHFVDLRKHTPGPKELGKWVQRFDVEGVINADSKPYREQGLAYLSAPDEDWIERLRAEPAILCLPLGRCGADLSVGEDPQAWQRFADAVKAAGQAS
jgi:arsenate reductase-like glutaredoxin family protein